MERFFGGHPASVALRLVIISIVVGIVLRALDLNPFDVVESLRALIRYISETGLEWIRWLLEVLLIGAVIVVPVWLIVRLVKAATSSTSKDRGGGQ